MKRIVLADGCFWGVEAYFKLLKGVKDTSVGYANGNFEHPTYQDLIKHRATHAEAVAIVYDPHVISLEKLLEHMFRFIDPTAIDRQGNDIGHQYRTGIYYKDDENKVTIESFLKKIAHYYNKPLAIEIEEEKQFYDAEDYHQDYLDKNPYGYCHVNLGLVKPDERK